jgi:hypothetical protein
MLIFWDIVVAILKMAIGRNFSMAGINSQFLPVAIFKIATTIPQKFNIVRYHQNLICG